MAKEGSSQTDIDEGTGAISDIPVGSKHDFLGFRPYVEAVKDFLTHPETNPPLTISIEGEWGVGKSSFLKQLEQLLREDDELTVTFNPWQHQQEESLWAAFALEFLRQIREDLSWKRRWKGHIYLMVRRLRRESGIGELIRVSIILFVLFAISIIIGIAVFTTGKVWIPAIIGSELNKNLGNSLIDLIAGTSGLAVALVSALTIWQRVKQRIAHPLRSALLTAIQDPGYEERISFITEFHNDFNDIIETYTGDRTVYVFIDDLDRCGGRKASELMQAINLLVASQPGVIFIIALDRKMIAAGVATKNREIIPYLRNMYQYPIEKDTSKEYYHGLSFGYRYLEKFIQIPILVPEPNEKDIRKFVRQIVNNETPETKEEYSRIDPLLLEKWSETIEDITGMVAPALNNNPRKIKRFVNLYHLRIRIADINNLFSIEKRGDEIYFSTDNSLTLPQLAKFIAISIRHPQFISQLNIDSDLLAKLESYALADDPMDDEIPMGIEQWMFDDSILDLLQNGIKDATDEQAETHSLQEVDVQKLLQISPRIDEPTKTRKTWTGSITVPELPTVEYSLPGTVKRDLEKVFDSNSEKIHKFATLFAEDISDFDGPAPVARIIGIEAAHNIDDIMSTVNTHKSNDVDDMLIYMYLGKLALQQMHLEESNSV